MDDTDRVGALWPRPHRVTRTGDACRVADGDLWQIGTSGPVPIELAQRLALELEQHGFCASKPEASRAAGARVLSVQLVQGGTRRDESYRLEVTSKGVRVEAAGEAGLFYGTRTLLQLFGRRDAEAGELILPGAVIEDAPSFGARGFMLDVSRDKVPSLATLFDLVDTLANLKFNQLQLYMEHTFAYRGHDAVWAAASPLTAREVQQLDAYCRARLIELVPNQNSFGHMQRWLKHGEYRALAECPDGFEHPWNPSGEPYGLCADDPRSLALLADLYDQLAESFSSKTINVGLDETLDLGNGRSRARCEREGTPRVYLAFLRDVHRLVGERGFAMQFWADMALQAPELLRELPRDAVALAWGYEADHPFAADASALARAGLPFYVCPGTSSWNSLAGRSANALANLHGAAQAGLAAGAAGYLVTDWGDNGHLQPLPVSYLGLVAGAGVAWNAGVGDELEAATVRCLNEHVFCDRAQVMGGVMRDLGNTYLHAGACPPNASALFGLLLHPERELPLGVTASTLARVVEVVLQAASPLARAAMNRPDAALIQSEVGWVRDALLVAARLGTARASESPASEPLCAELRRLLDQHQRQWLARNRPGGLADSAARLRRALVCVSGAGPGFTNAGY